VIAAHAGMILYWVHLARGPVNNRLPGTPAQSLAQTLVVITFSALFLAGATRGIIRCRLAPGRLLAAPGDGAVVLFVGSGGRLGTIGWPVSLHTAAGTKVELRVLDGAREYLTAGDAGVLYRRGRYAAFVTDACTYWAVGDVG